EGDIAGHLQYGLDTDRELREERVREIVEHDADDLGIRIAQIGGAAVVDVAEPTHDLQHMTAGLLLDAAAAGEDERDCRFRDAGSVRDIDDRYRLLGRAPLRHVRPLVVASTGTFHIAPLYFVQ